MIANLFLIGAPKSGTTSVANSLGRHPDIFLPHVKEPHYFGSDTGQAVVDMTEYSKLFDKAKSERFRLDASTHTLRSVDAIEQILELVPDARFIVLLRDPVEAVPAFHSQLLRHFVEPEEDFATAWAQQAARASGRVDGPLYHSVFDYGRQIERLERLVTKDNCRVFPFTALKADGEKVICEIVDFLDLAQVKLELKNDNSNIEHKFRGLHRRKQALAPKIRSLKGLLGIQKNLGLGKVLFGWNSKARGRKPLSPHVLEALRHNFEKDYEQVECITGIDIRNTALNHENINSLRLVPCEPGNEG